jgi:U3 small nucleolar RNA-associated protein 12
VEVFRVRSDDDIRKKHARRKKRADAKAALGKGEKVNDVPDNGDAEKVELTDLFTPYLIVRATGKIKSFALPEETRTKSATQVRCQDDPLTSVPCSSIIDLLRSVQQRHRSV